MNDKLLSLLGICRKAGKLAHGFDAAGDTLKKREAELILTAKDLSPKSKKEIEFIASKHNVDVISIPATIDEIGTKTGKRAGILSVTDKGLAKSLRDGLSRVNEEE